MKNIDVKRISLILLIVSIVACETERDPLPTELPPITEEGNNTFGCMIENEIYVPEIRRTSWSIPGLQSDPIEFTFPHFPDYYFIVSTVRLVDEDDELKDVFLSFHIDTSVIKTGNYQFSYISVEYENTYYYLDTTINKGMVNISRYDSINKIISGTFDFSVIDKNNTNSKILNITKGRFDLKSL